MLPKKLIIFMRLIKQSIFINSNFQAYPHEEEMDTGTMVNHPHQHQQMAAVAGTEENAGMLMDDGGYQVIEPGETMMEEATGNLVGKTRSVHQCPVCEKIFVSFKGF
jgi:hypothetical protein